MRGALYVIFFSQKSYLSDMAGVFNNAWIILDFGKSPKVFIENRAIKSG
jgi:hypothetical protein